MKYFYLVFLLLPMIDLCGQTGNLDIDISIGYTYIPLKIQRNNVNRWMIYPTLGLNFKLNEKLNLSAGYLGHDSRIKNFSNEEKSKYKEVPELTSYEIAKMYEGKKFTISLFSDYIFAGVQFVHLERQRFALRSNLLIGYRQGETSVLSFISENPSWPNGFEVHSDIQSSDSPGIKYALAPRLKFGKIFSMEFLLGSFIFINWPSVQPFGNVQVCATL